MKKLFIWGLLIAPWLVIAQPVVVQAEDCGTVTSASIKDADGFLPAPSLKVPGVKLDFAADQAMSVPDNMANFTYIGVNGATGPMVFDNAKEYFLHKTSTPSAGIPPIPLPDPFGLKTTALTSDHIKYIKAHKVFGFIMSVPTESITNYTTGDVEGTITVTQWYHTEMADSAIITDSGTFWSKVRAIAGDNPTNGIWQGVPFAPADRKTCTVKIPATYATQLAEAKKAGIIKENDVTNVLDGQNAEDTGVCGKPTLKSILTFAFCSLLDAMISFLAALI
jgi:hypothetical protein